MENIKRIQNIPRWPYADEEEEKILIEVLHSDNWWRNAGYQVKSFEKEFAHYHNCIGGIAMANGTVAIEIALKALGVGEGDEVIVPDFTFYSTVSAVLKAHAIPVIVDVDPNTFCIEPKKIEEAITEKTKAIIPVHIAGHVADMKSIMELAKKNNLYVIEDSSHAHGAVWNGKKAGSMGTMATFSFQNAKLMTAGEGGIVISNNGELLHRVLLEANCGRAENDTTYQHILIGTNARLSEFQGAILKAQLKRLDEQIDLRESNYAYLCEKIEQIHGITLQKKDDAMERHPHYMVMFYYDKKYFNSASRDEFVQYIKRAGISSNRSYEAIHRLPVFQSLPVGSWRFGSKDSRKGEIQCPNSVKISEEVICLNHNMLLGDKKLIDDIIDVIKSFSA